MAYHGHICGFYYILPTSRPSPLPKRYYLPQVDLKAHSTILASLSRTVLTQTFVNPGENVIRQLRYAFPLYDGVSVVGFTCQVDDRIIKGRVKERERAKRIYREAVSRGQTAGLLEQLPSVSDVFTTAVGNVPPKARITVEITFVGELKHDAEVDGIRFTIPTSISPRYGNYPGELMGPVGHMVQTQGGIQIIVDVSITEGSFIKEMRSPSHPISVSLGTTSVSTNEDPKMHRASATLSLGSAELEKDFVLQIATKDTGIPKAILETHPTIPNQRALMVTLVPRFSLPPSRPEIVFICDQSGSMMGQKTTTLIAALKVFLKSLPVGVKFNICAFGSLYRFLWPKSKSYGQDTLGEATAFVEKFNGDYGGTEMYEPIEATLSQRYKDIPLEVMLLTDGEIWDQNRLFQFLNKEIIESRAPIRVFTLGVGKAVSHSLIEGIARAGNGFSQAVGEGEKLDSKVVRMLKGGLSPHVTDYTLEIKYGEEEHGSADDDFEIVEKVAYEMHVNLNLGHNQPKSGETKKPILLYDSSTDPDLEVPPLAYDEGGSGRYDCLPDIPFPKLLQAPHRIPPLFPFTRTSVYVLMSPDTIKGMPKSVVLRGTSSHGPLELEIPIHVLREPGEIIHQLAAKKAITELEQGRSWLAEARDKEGKLLKERLESQFEEIVEREAVRLGVKYQVGGKWCSFVAVEQKEGADHGSSGPSHYELTDALGGETAVCCLEEDAEVSECDEDMDFSIFDSSSPPPQVNTGAPVAARERSYFGGWGSRIPSSAPGGLCMQRRIAGASEVLPPLHSGIFSASQRLAQPQLGAPFGATSLSSNFSANFAFGSAAAPASKAEGITKREIPGANSSHEERRGAFGFAGFVAPLQLRKSPNVIGSSNNYSSPPKSPASSNDDPVTALIDLQSFEGYWNWTGELFKILGVDVGYAECSRQGIDHRIFATILTILGFEQKLQGEKERWELVVEKARSWVESQGSRDQVTGWYHVGEKLLST